METFAHLQDAIRAIIPADAINRMRLNAMQRHQKGYDPMPVVRLYVPFTCCQWLLTEIDEDLDTAFGLCDLGMGFPELGYVSLFEIAEVTPHVRCDPHFVAVAPLSVYSREAHNAQGIVLAWEGVPFVEPEDVPTVDELYASFEEDAAGTGAFDNTGCAHTNSAEELNQTETLPLAHFLEQFRQPLLEQIEKQTPVVYGGQHAAWQDDILAGLKRTPFPAQAHRIHAVYAGLVERDLPAVFLNGEMGTGKTMMGICLAALMYRGYSQKPVLVISPPHLVYKWRREILDTIPQAAVTVINGSNAIIDLIRFRERLVDGRLEDGRQHFLVIGRVRMRMGFYWKPAYWKRPYRYLVKSDEGKRAASYEAIACPCCGSYQTNREGVPTMAMPEWGSERREYCQNKECAAPLWTMRHKGEEEQSAETRLRGFLKQLPGIGKVTANRLIDTFGVENLSKIIDNNIYDFVNLQKGDGDFMFGDKHAQRLEKALGRLEFALQMVSYQPSEYVKRYFPRKAFSLALVDEAHEYKNQGSAQGQAMAVLCNESEKVVCLTGTLMGGYASDLFHLLFRAMPGVMSRMGYAANRHNSFAAAEERFMRTYGCLIDVYSVNDEGSHLTAKGKKTSMHTKKAPGFSSPGIARFVLPYTVFMRLADLGEGILPDYQEETRRIAMSNDMRTQYLALSARLRLALDTALSKRDNSLTAVVINALLRWPETCAREEVVMHPREREMIASAPAIFDGHTPSPKEADLIEVCKAEAAAGRRVIAYTVYTGGHDTASRLANLLKQAGLKAAVLRSTVSSDAREDWIADKVEQGIDVLVCNPELVKTGLDLLAFPTIYFMQTGYNVYTMAQAARRSWRIGQKDKVKVYYACYEDSTQVQCLELMARKTKTALSTMGVMPETGLDSFIDDEEDSEASITEALAKNLLGR